MKPLTAAATSAPPREEELVAAAKDGNPYAFEALFRRYRGPITGYVRARVRDEGRTEDIVQEIFFSAHNSLATLSKPRAFRGWLYQIAQQRLPRRGAAPQPQRGADPRLGRVPAARRADRRSQPEPGATALPEAGARGCHACDRRASDGPARRARDARARGPLLRGDRAPDESYAGRGRERAVPRAARRQACGLSGRRLSFRFRRSSGVGRTLRAQAHLASTRRARRHS